MTTDETIADAVRYLPGGAYATVGRNPSPRPEIIFSHGDGAYVHTTDGERMLDVMLGHGSLVLGHCNPAVGEAVKAQVDRGNAFTHVTAPAIELARLLVEAVPCAEKVRFVSSGSEAVMLALRLVRAYTGRDKVLKLEGAYHGFGDGLLFSTNYGDPNSWSDSPQSTPDSLGIPAGAQELVLTTPYNDLDRTREIVGENQADLAAIFVEPVSRGLASAPGYMEGMRDIASEFQIPLVFDEVNTGFRLALGGAQAYYGVTPDVAILGKAMASGYPIGAVAGGEEIMSYLDPASPDDRRIFELGAFHSNAISATASVATLEEMQKPGVFEGLNEYGDRLRGALADLFARYDISVQMTGEGSIVHFLFTDEPITDYRSALRSNTGLSDRLGEAIRRHGIFGGGGRWTSSIYHGDAEMGAMLDAVDASLSELRDAGELG